MRHTRRADLEGKRPGRRGARARAMPGLLLPAVLLLAALDTGAEDRVLSRVDYYADDDHTTVISPMVIIQKDVYDQTSVELEYLADIQSCASVDVVSSASPSLGYEETRHSFTVGLTHRRKLATLGLGYGYSTENDYTSNYLAASVSREMFQRNLTASLNFSFRWDRVGRVLDDYFSEDLQGATSSLALTQTISPRLVGQLVYFLEVLEGYQSSPYRVVPVADFSVAETLPGRRIRQSVTGRLKESLSDRWSAEQSLRFYLDSWGMTAETLLLQAYWEVREPFTLRLRYRFHNQDRADFYRERYDRLQEFVTRDRELGTLQSHLLGPQVLCELEDLWVFPRAVFDIKLEYFYINYRDYALRDNLEGLLLGSGLELYY